MSNESKRAYGYLDRLFERDESFMTAHQPMKDRGAAGAIKRHVPPWAKDDAFVRGLLLRTFPNWQSDPKQRDRMGTWYRTIYLYYRRQVSAGRVAKTMGDVPLDTIRNRLRSIRSAAKGLNTAGKPRRVITGPPKEASVKRRELRREKSRVLDLFEDKLTPRGRRLDSDGVPVSLTWQLVREKNRVRVSPLWAKDRGEIFEVIATAFPKWRTKQLEQASRWFQIIHYYFRKKGTRKEVARLMRMTDTQVRATLERISKVHEGQNAAGRARRQGGPGNLRHHQISLGTY
jgi:hypothetical protein